MTKPLAFSTVVACLTLLPYFYEKGFKEVGVVDMFSVFLFFLIIFWVSFELNKRDNEKNK